MAGVATIAGTLADAKVAAKAALTTALGNYTQGNYTTDNWTALNGFKTAGDLAIDAAGDLAAVDTAKTTALNEMAGVQTIESISVLGITESGVVQQIVSEGTDTVDASSAAGAFATITGSGGQTVRIEKISSTTASEGGFLIEGATSYVDLYLNTSEGVEQIQFTVLGGAGIPMWWNGSSWIECSNYTIDASGNVTITITGSTSPSLSELTGTVFTVVATTPAISVLGITELGTTEEERGPSGPAINEKPISDYDKTNSDFVNLFYNRLLSRAPEEVGLDAWVAGLTSGALTGADLVNQFIFGKECQSIISKYTNEQFITFLYKTLFNRAPDSGGLNAWLARRSAGMTKEGVVNGFIHSLEFELICKNFGIKPYLGYTGTGK